MSYKTSEPSKDAPRVCRRLPFWVISGAIGLTLGFQSCTAIGLAIGANAANRSPKYLPLQISELHALRAGQLLRIEDTTGRIVKGKYKGLSNLPKDQYSKKYQSYLNQLDQQTEPLPEMNEVIAIRYADSLDERNLDSALLFQGFGAGNLFVSRSLDDTLQVIPISEINRLVQSSGIELSRQRVQILIDQKKVPLKQLAILNINGRLVDIPLNDVQRMFTYKGGRGGELVLLGLGIGLAFDYLIIATFLFPGLFF